jgi:quinol-cytochrome oxidoreductase complex cytochrome b subunit
MIFTGKFMEELFEMLNRPKVKKEMNKIIQPIVEIITDDVVIEIQPYLYLALIMTVCSFLLTLAIFILVLRSHGVLRDK